MHGCSRFFEHNEENLITKVACDVIGIEKLDASAAILTERITRESLKELIKLAVYWSEKCARKRLTVADVESVQRIMPKTDKLSLQSVDTLNYGVDQLVAASSSSNIFSYNNCDVEVDKEDTESFSAIPRGLRLISYELLIDGQSGPSSYTINNDDEDTIFFDKSAPSAVFSFQETISQDARSPRSCTKMFRSSIANAKVGQKVGLKSVAVETLTLEQQVFMKEIITVCMGQDDKRRLEALYTLETDAGLQVVLPHLVLRICKSISANISQRCLSLIIYAGRVLRAISHNKSCDMTTTLHNVMPALLSCCVGRSICLKPETDNHWALRDFSAKTLVGLIRDHVEKNAVSETSRRLFDFAYSVFKNQKSSFSMIYGTIFILEEFVEPDRITWLLGKFSEMITRCKLQIDATHRHGAHAPALEASKLHSQILKCEGLLKSRTNGSRWHQ